MNVDIEKNSFEMLQNIKLKLKDENGNLSNENEKRIFYLEKKIKDSITAIVDMQNEMSSYLREIPTDLINKAQNERAEVIKLIDNVNNIMKKESAETLQEIEKYLTSIYNEVRVNEIEHKLNQFSTFEELKNDINKDSFFEMSGNNILSSFNEEIKSLKDVYRIDEKTLMKLNILDEKISFYSKEYNSVSLKDELENNETYELETDDPYEILNVSKDATLEEIMEAYLNILSHYNNMLANPNEFNDYYNISEIIKEKIKPAYKKLKENYKDNNTHKVPLDKQIAVIPNDVEKSLISVDDISNNVEKSLISVDDNKIVPKRIGKDPKRWKKTILFVSGALLAGTANISTSGVSKPIVDILAYSGIATGLIDKIIKKSKNNGIKKVEEATAEQMNDANNVTAKMKKYLNSEEFLGDLMIFSTGMLIGSKLTSFATPLVDTNIVSPDSLLSDNNLAFNDAITPDLPSVETVVPEVPSVDVPTMDAITPEIQLENPTNYNDIIIGENIGDTEILNGYNNSFNAIEGTDGLNLNQEIMNDGNSMYNRFVILDESGSVIQNIDGSGISVQDLINQGYDPESIAVDVSNMQGDSRAWVPVSEINVGRVM